jgi:catechol 2,3-dioxygenase-like lactoylglutathione lyase family enzyme
VEPDPKGALGSSNDAVSVDPPPRWKQLFAHVPSDFYADLVADIEALITFLFASDLQASSGFYRDALGLELVIDQGDCHIYRVTDTAFLGVCLRPDRVHGDGMIVTIVTDDVDTFHQRMVAAGVVVESEPEHSKRYGLHHAFYRDPDDHLVEVQRFDDPYWAATNK